MTDFLLMVSGALFAMFISGIVNYKKAMWQGLTDEEIYEVVKDKEGSPWRVIVDAIEAKLKEKNNA
jgi:hypothetical protein